MTHEKYNPAGGAHNDLKRQLNLDKFPPILRSLHRVAQRKNVGDEEGGENEESDEEDDANREGWGRR